MENLTSLEVCLHGTLRGRIMREFFTNSAHFPIILILLELLMSGPLIYLSEPDVYALLLAAGVQAYWLGSRDYRGLSCPFWGNLIAPALYTLAEVLLELDDQGLLDGFEDFFSAPHHIAFWVFSFCMGSLQSLRLHHGGPILSGSLIVLENLARTFILGVMYFIFEHASKVGAETTVHLFLHDRSHIFIILSLLFIGLLMGVAHLNAETFLNRLRATSEQLHVYSTWLLGSQLLDNAVQDPASLTLQRRERTVLFMDIRGFTAWSESQPPEQVVSMLNKYFEVAEDCWSNANEFAQVIKVKHTGDEVMIVFGSADAAIDTARCLRHKIGALLANYQLGAGIGIHCGPLVEGLLGSREVRSYDIIGDTVNTAKRICDKAATGEILISKTLFEHLPTQPDVSEQREVSVKGKSEPLALLALRFA